MLEILRNIRTLPSGIRPLLRRARIPAFTARRASNWLGIGLDLVFPPACMNCHALLSGGAEGLLCPTCRDEISDDRAICERCGVARPAATVPGPCPRCRNERFWFDSVLRLGVYEGTLRRAVLRVKNPGERGLAIALGERLAAVHGERLSRWRPDAVVPVPMHWSRKLRRGANSPELLAERLAARLGIPLAPQVLSRRRRTAPQARLSPNQRRTNVRGAFWANAHRDLPGARLLLVDDIMTTGATVNEAAKALSRAGADSIAVIVLARAEGLV